MKLRRWSRGITWVTGCFMAGCIALLIFYFGWHTILDAWRKLLLGNLAWSETWRLLAIPLTLLLLTGVSVVNIVLGILFRYKVMRPLEKAVAFAEAIARNETPEMLTPGADSDEDVAALQMSLNVLRDRQQSQLARSRQNMARILKAGRERDTFESLKRRVFGEMLPEVRRGLGILKGQLLIQLAEFDRSADPGKQYYRDLLVKSIRRQSSLARALEAAVDINRFDWKRWNEPVSDRFDTADFIYELLEGVRAISRSRKVLLVNENSPDIPGRLYADRELLFYLLSVLLRSACRLAVPESEVVFKTLRDERGEALFELHFVLRDLAMQKIASQEENLFGVAFEIVRSTASFIGCEVDATIQESKVKFLLSLPAGASLYDCAGVTALPSTSLFAGTPVAVDDRELAILLLDDDQDGAETLVEIMKSYHQQWSVCRGESDLLTQLRERSFDAVVVTSPFADRAPGELLEKIRDIRVLPVILTSCAFPDEAQRKFDFIGRTAYLSMPLNYELLNEVIRRLCR